jgi:type II secretory pathway component PulM
MAQAQSQWQRTTPAGKRYITVASALLIAGLGWALVYEPLQSGLKRNRERIAELSNQASRMRDQAAEVARIRATAPVAAVANTAVADVAGLQAILGPQSVVTLTNSASSGIAFKVSVSPQPYSSLIDRIDQATAKYRVRISSLSLTRSAGTPAGGGAAPKLVSGEIVLVDVR